MARLLNDFPRWILIAVWILGNVGMFVYSFFKYKNSINFYYLRLITGDALSWARASAACLNLNCMLILIPVCRNLISFLRGSLKRCCTKTFRRQLDKHITFHRYIAYMICLHTAIHIGAHVFNVERMFLAHDQEGLLSALSNLDDGNLNQTYVNPVRDADEDPTLFVMKTIAGASGVIATLALILIYSSSTEVIRRSYFEVFWFTHHLFIIFFIAIIVHGLGGIVREQTNTAQHDPEFCQDKFDKWGPNEPKCPTPQFAHGFPSTFQWVVGPIFLYGIERLVRFIRSKQQVVITKVVKHPSNVFELQMKKRGFKMGPGQYIFIKCPKISHLEWHPFTLTSAPDDEYFSVHIRRVGNWTNALAKECHVDEGEFKEAWKLPRIAVDGPFGTATEDILSYSVDIFVAGGIGVTPFASVLKHICYKIQKYKKQIEMDDFKLRRVYFFWICPDTNAFEWLHDLLKYYDKQMADTGFTDFLKYFVYLTRGWDMNMAKAIVLHDEEIYDAVTGLYQKTHYGRPNWDQILPNIAKDHPDTKIGVFFCGPSVLSSTLHKACNSHSTDGVKFYYNKENF